MGQLIQGRALIPAEATGTLLVSQEPLSFWGGYDQRTGEVIDRRHPLSGQIAARRILAIPFTRGSSTTTAVLLEAVRAGVAPAAIITTEVDHFLTLASIVADELYQKPIPIIAVAPADFQKLSQGAFAAIQSDGVIVLS